MTAEKNLPSMTASGTEKGVLGAYAFICHCAEPISAIFGYYPDVEIEGGAIKEYISSRGSSYNRHITPVLNILIKCIGYEQSHPDICPIDSRAGQCVREFRTTSPFERYQKIYRLFETCSRDDILRYIYQIRFCMNDSGNVGLGLFIDITMERMDWDYFGFIRKRILSDMTAAMPILFKGTSGRLSDLSYWQKKGVTTLYLGGGGFLEDTST